MIAATWHDSSRNKDEDAWVAEVFRREEDEEPMQTLAWYATEEEAEAAAALFIYEASLDRD